MQRKSQRRVLFLLISIAMFMLYLSPSSRVMAFNNPWDSEHNPSNLPPESPSKPPEDPCEESTGSPVYMRVGNLVLGFTDLSFPNTAIPFEIHRNYNSQEKYNGPFGHGWVMTYTHQLIEVVKNNTIEQVIIRKELGQRFTFIKNADETFSPSNPDSYDVLRDNGDGTYTLNPGCSACGSRFGTDEYHFNTAGFIASIVDMNGNSIIFHYDEDDRLVNVTENSGRFFSFTYDTNNKITSITDSAGRTLTYTYDEDDHLISVTNPLSQTIRYAYDSEHRLISLTDPKGNIAIEVTYDSEGRISSYSQYGDSVTYTYDTENNEVTKTDSLGNATTFTYASSGVITNILYSDGSEETFAYDEKLNLVSFTDGNGNTTTHTYDSNGNMTSQTDPLGNTRTSTYDMDSNRLLQEADSRGIVTKHEYDSHGNLLQKYRAFGTSDQIEESYTYDTLGRKLTYTDPNGNTTTYDYDSSGNLITVTDPYNNIIETNTYNALGKRISKTDLFGNTTQYDYDALGRLTSVTGAKGNVTYTTYDENGNVASEIDGNGNTTTHEYNFFNQLVKVTDPLGHTTEMGYTERGNLKWVKDPTGNVTNYTYNDRGKNIEKSLNTIITTYDYDFNGNRIQEINPNGKITISTYDALDRVVSRTLPTGEILSFTYDAEGNLLNQTHGNGLSLSYGYDNLNRVTSIYDTGGTMKSFSYDGLGNPLTKTDGSGNTTTFEYDERGKLTKRIYSDSSFDIIEYDSGGRMIKITDRGGNEVTFTYDELNRIVSSTDGLNNTISATYDASRLLTVTDAKENTTAYEYDATNNKIRETYADGSLRMFSYDANGRLLTKTDAAGNTINFEYNEKGLLTKRSYPGDDDVFTYGLAGELLSAVNNNATVLRTYDDSGRILTETINGKTMQYSYDMANLSRTITYPGGKVIKEVFDSRERLASIQDTSETPIFSFQYNLMNKRTSLSYLNGISAQYSYDTLNLLSNITYANGASPVVNNDYVRTSTGRIQAVVDKVMSENSERYQYDPIDRLVGFKRGSVVNNDIPSPARQVSYTLDNMSNWLEKTTDGNVENRTVNNLHEYLTVGGISFSHDANGNLSDDGIHTYSYDAMNRLTQVQLKSDESTLTEFRYDALGRLISKITPTETINYYYDLRFRIIEEQINDTTFATYIYGPGQDEILRMETGGQIYYYHSDSRSNVLAVTDLLGNVVERYQYDPYGKISIFNSTGSPVSGSLIGNTFFYKGKKYHPEVGLYFFRARFFSPLIGRFLTRDPIGYGLNLYEYAYSDPINFDDVFGLAPESCRISSSLEFDIGKLRNVTKVIKAFGVNFQVGGGITLKVSACEAKCCKKQIRYSKWELEADFSMTYGGFIPNLSVSIPGVGGVGLHGSITFGVKGAGTLSETFDENCNVTCANNICVGVYGGVTLFMGAKLAESGDDDLVDDPFGGGYGIKGSLGASGTVCWGCSGWEFKACVSGSIELVASIKVFWMSYGGAIEIIGGSYCSSKT